MISPLPGISLSPTDQASMRLVTAVQELSLARNLETIVDIVRKAARELSRADGASFVLRDGDLCHYVDEDAIGPLWKGQRFPISICVSGWAMVNRKAAVIPDIYQDDRIPVDAYSPTFVKSLVMVPIRTEAPVGAIGIYWAKPNAASDFEVEMLQALANSTSVAMENVRLYTELEQRVQERTQQLEQVNRELEAFSSSVSHDLQAPLRHIDVYLDLLVQKETAALDETSRDYIRRVQSSTARMSSLIADLLRLSRYARAELNCTRIDLSLLGREIAQNLQDETPGRAAEFRFQEGVQADGDPALLRIVLENLLANAWKFTSKREKTLIEFGRAPQADGSASYFVKDNGAGFDMRYATNLFIPFQRLHSQKDFTGTGIGLATVGRIIHRHGGRIWADAAPDAGATFSFTLGTSLAQAA